MSCDPQSDVVIAQSGLFFPGAGRLSPGAVPVGPVPRTPVGCPSPASFQLGMGNRPTCEGTRASLGCLEVSPVCAEQQQSPQRRNVLPWFSQKVLFKPWL